MVVLGKSVIYGDCPDTVLKNDQMVNSNDFMVGKPLSEISVIILYPGSKTPLESESEA